MDQFALFMLVILMAKRSSREIALRTKTFGFFVRRRRLTANLTQGELAALARTRQSIISRLEKCERFPRSATLERIKRALEEVRK
jgi:predicted transcriptional regulator